MALVAAKDGIHELNLLTDVIYEPEEAWHHANLSQADGTNCSGLIDHYTATAGASMTFQFEGVQYQIRHEQLYHIELS